VADAIIPFFETFVTAGTSNVLKATITPRDVYHSQQRIIDDSVAKQKYLELMFVVDDVVNISLPSTLTGVTVEATESKGGQSAIASGNSSSATATASASYDVAVGFSIRDGYSGLAPAKKYIYFIDPQSGDRGSIYARIPDGGVREWPVAQTETNTITLIVNSERVSATASVSLPDNKSKSISVDRSSSIQIFNVPNTLHSLQNVQQNSSFTHRTSAEARGPQSGDAIVDAEAKAEYKITGQINATTPTKFPTGKFLYSVNSQLYRFGLIKIEATVVDVTDDMV
jgi:hypothetical protein